MYKSDNICYYKFNYSIHFFICKKQNVQTTYQISVLLLLPLLRKPHNLRTKCFYVECLCVWLKGKGSLNIKGYHWYGIQYYCASSWRQLKVSSLLFSNYFITEQ